MTSMLISALLFAGFNEKSYAYDQYFETIDKFMSAIIAKDEQQAKSYLKDGAKLPFINRPVDKFVVLIADIKKPKQITENSIIRDFTGLLLPQQKNVKRTIGYSIFEEKERDLSFIWDITISKEKISDIRVVYSGDDYFSPFNHWNN